jgi:hypothetical protein
VLFAILALVFWGLVAWGLWTRVRWLGSRNWPSTRGTITASSRTESKSNDPSTHQSTVTYGASVHYDYIADRRPFTGSRVTFGDYETSNPAHAASILARYPKGREVTVWYDPDDPSYAVLEREIGGNWIVLLVGGILGGITTFLFFRR